MHMTRFSMYVCMWFAFRFCFYHEYWRELVRRDSAYIHACFEWDGLGVGGWKETGIRRYAELAAAILLQIILANTFKFTKELGNTQRRRETWTGHRQETWTQINR